MDCPVLWFLTRVAPYIAIAAVVGLLAAACTHAVYLKHPATGQVVECSGHWATDRGRLDSQRCVNDYKMAGYMEVQTEPVTVPAGPPAKSEKQSFGKDQK